MLSLKHFTMKTSLKYLILIVSTINLTSCEKEDSKMIYPDQVKKIKIGHKFTVDNGVLIKNSDINLIKYEEFLKYLASSNRFLIVTQKDFPTTTSTDKVIISLRYDIDDDINAAVKFAYRENKYNIKSTYYILHTASYYGITKLNYFKRNDNIIYYLKKIQDDFGQEIGWHNDLVTLQIIYNLDSKSFLKNELEWLRGNGINIYGTCAHGREYCYVYRYVNSYFWKETDGSNNRFFYNWEFIPKDGKQIQIEKDNLSNYNLYDANQFKSDYFFADVNRIKGKLWHMGLVNFDTIQPGKKVIILLHPQYWN